MKVPDVNASIYQVNQANGNTATGAARRTQRPEKASEGTDSVSLSAQGRELLALRKQFDEAPEIREALVDDLRRQVAEGTYHPAATQIAAKMLAELKGLTQE